MNWELHEKQPDGTWAKVAEKRTADNCKAVAKARNRSEYQYTLGKEFIIRDPSGQVWARSVHTGSWRMKWEM